MKDNDIALFLFGVLIGFCIGLTIAVLYENGGIKKLYTKIHNWFFRKQMPKYRIMHNGYYYIVQKKLGFSGWQIEFNPSRYAKYYQDKEEAEDYLLNCIEHDKVRLAKFKEVPVARQSDLYKTLTGDKE